MADPGNEPWRLPFPPLFSFVCLCVWHQRYGRRRCSKYGGKPVIIFGGRCRDKQNFRGRRAATISSRTGIFVQVLGPQLEVRRVRVSFFCFATVKKNKCVCVCFFAGAAVALSSWNFWFFFFFFWHGEEAFSMSVVLFFLLSCFFAFYGNRDSYPALPPPTSLCGLSIISEENSRKSIYVYPIEIPHRVGLLDVFFLLLPVSPPSPSPTPPPINYWAILRVGKYHIFCQLPAGH